MDAMKKTDRWDKRPTWSNWVHSIKVVVSTKAKVPSSWIEESNGDTRTVVARKAWVEGESRQGS